MNLKKFLYGDGLARGHCLSTSIPAAPCFRAESTVDVGDSVISHAFSELAASTQLFDTRQANIKGL
ncbi:hypothetical protein [uncultured Bradyrhizobium sp.]|uniref:hypothetical protein n=1 Tax=uncultured Bradyrhizobium sp. TaxID=199684 RepID=UPI0035CA3F54